MPQQFAGLTQPAAPDSESVSSLCLLSPAEGDQRCCSFQNIPGVWKTAIPGAAGQVAGNHFHITS